MVAFARREFSGGAVPSTIPTGMGSSDGTFTLSVDTNWPTGGALGNFSVVVDRGLATEEKIECASSSGLVVTVASGGRGYDGTSAVSHAAGCNVQVCHIAQDDDEANQLVANLGNVAKGSLILGGGSATLPGSLAALAEGSLLIGKGTGNNPAALAVGASNAVLLSNGTDPTWETLAGLTALVGNLLMPVGFIFHSGGSSPIATASALATALGFGTWAAYAPGRSLMGVGSLTDGNGDTQVVANNTAYGEFNHLNSAAESGQPGFTASTGGASVRHQHPSVNLDGGGYTFAADGGDHTIEDGQTGNDSPDHSHSTTVAAADAANRHNNIHPVLGTYMYIRTA